MGEQSADNLDQSSVLMEADSDEDEVDTHFQSTAHASDEGVANSCVTNESQPESAEHSLPLVHPREVFEAKNPGDEPFDMRPSVLPTASETHVPTSPNSCNSGNSLPSQIPFYPEEKPSETEQSKSELGESVAQPQEPLEVALVNVEDNPDPVCSASASDGSVPATLDQIEEPFEVKQPDLTEDPADGAFSNLPQDKDIVHQSSPAPGVHENPAEIVNVVLPDVAVESQVAGNESITATSRCDQSGKTTEVTTNRDGKLAEVKEEASGFEELAPRLHKITNNEGPTDEDPLLSNPVDAANPSQSSPEISDDSQITSDQIADAPLEGKQSDTALEEEHQAIEAQSVFAKDSAHSIDTNKSDLYPPVQVASSNDEASGLTPETNEPSDELNVHDAIQTSPALGIQAKVSIVESTIITPEDNSEIAMPPEEPAPDYCVKEESPDVTEPQESTIMEASITPQTNLDVTSNASSVEALAAVHHGPEENPSLITPDSPSTVQYEEQLTVLTPDRNDDGSDQSGTNIGVAADTQANSDEAAIMDNGESPAFEEQASPELGKQVVQIKESDPNVYPPSDATGDESLQVVSKKLSKSYSMEESDLNQNQTSTQDHDEVVHVNNQQDEILKDFQTDSKHDSHQALFDSAAETSSPPHPASQEIPKATSEHLDGVEFVESAPVTSPKSHVSSEDELQDRVNADVVKEESRSSLNESKPIILSASQEQSVNEVDAALTSDASLSNRPSDQSVEDEETQEQYQAIPEKTSSHSQSANPLSSPEDVRIADVVDQVQEGSIEDVHETSAPAQAIVGSPLVLDNHDAKSLENNSSASTHDQSPEIPDSSTQNRERLTSNTEADPITPTQLGQETVVTELPDDDGPPTREDLAATLVQSHPNDEDASAPLPTSHSVESLKLSVDDSTAPEVEVSCVSVPPVAKQDPTTSFSTDASCDESTASPNQTNADDVDGSSVSDASASRLEEQNPSMSTVLPKPMDVPDLPTEQGTIATKQTSSVIEQIAPESLEGCAATTLNDQELETPDVLQDTTLTNDESTPTLDHVKIIEETIAPLSIEQPSEAAALPADNSPPTESEGLQVSNQSAPSSPINANAELPERLDSSPEIEAITQVQTPPALESIEDLQSAAVSPEPTQELSDAHVDDPTVTLIESAAIDESLPRDQDNSSYAAATDQPPKNLDSLESESVAPPSMIDDQSTANVEPSPDNLNTEPPKILDSSPEVEAITQVQTPPAIASAEDLQSASVSSEPTQEKSDAPVDDPVTVIESAPIDQSLPHDRDNSSYAAATDQPPKILDSPESLSVAQPSMIDDQSTANVEPSPVNLNTEPPKILDSSPEVEAIIQNHEEPIASHSFEQPSEVAALPADDIPPTESEGLSPEIEAITQVQTPPAIESTEDLQSVSAEPTMESSDAPADDPAVTVIKSAAIDESLPHEQDNSSYAAATDQPPKIFDSPESQSVAQAPSMIDDQSTSNVKPSSVIENTEPSKILDSSQEIYVTDDQTSPAIELTKDLQSSSVSAEPTQESSDAPADDPTVTVIESVAVDDSLPHDQDNSYSAAAVTDQPPKILDSPESESVAQDSSPSPPDDQSTSNVEHSLDNQNDEPPKIPDSSPEVEDIITQVQTPPAIASTEDLQSASVSAEPTQELSDAPVDGPAATVTESAAIDQSSPPDPDNSTYDAATDQPPKILDSPETKPVAQAPSMIDDQSTSNVEPSPVNENTEPPKMLDSSISNVEPSPVKESTEPPKMLDSSPEIDVTQDQTQPVIESTTSNVEDLQPASVVAASIAAEPTQEIFGTPTDEPAVAADETTSFDQPEPTVEGDPALPPAIQSPAADEPPNTLASSPDIGSVAQAPSASTMEATARDVGELTSASDLVEPTQVLPDSPVGAPVVATNEFSTVDQSVPNDHDDSTSLPTVHQPAETTEPSVDVNSVTIDNSPAANESITNLEQDTNISLSNEQPSRLSDPPLNKDTASRLSKASDDTLPAPSEQLKETMDTLPKDDVVMGDESVHVFDPSAPSAQPSPAGSVPLIYHSSFPEFLESPTPSMTAIPRPPVDPAVIAKSSPTRHAVSNIQREIILPAKMKKISMLSQRSSESLVLNDPDTLFTFFCGDRPVTQPTPTNESPKTSLNIASLPLLVSQKSGEPHKPISSTSRTRAQSLDNPRTKSLSGKKKLIKPYPSLKRIRATENTEHTHKRASYRSVIVQGTRDNSSLTKTSKNRRPKSIKLGDFGLKPKEPKPHTAHTESANDLADAFAFIEMSETMTYSSKADRYVNPTLTRRLSKSVKDILHKRNNRRLNMKTAPLDDVYIPADFHLDIDHELANLNNGSSHIVNDTQGHTAPERQTLDNTADLSAQEQDPSLDVISAVRNSIDKSKKSLSYRSHNHKHRKPL